MPDEAIRRTFSSLETTRLTGASPVQIEHLCRTGAIVPAEEAPRRGMSRRFSLRNLVEIVVGLDLSDHGIPVGNIKGVFVETLDKAWPQLCDPIQRTVIAALVLEFPRTPWETAGSLDGRRAASNEDLTYFERLLPVGTFYRSRLLPIDAVSAILAAGNTIRAINLKRIIESLEEATGERLAE